MKGYGHYWSLAREAPLLARSFKTGIPQEGLASSVCWGELGSSIYCTVYYWLAMSSYCASYDS